MMTFHRLPPDVLELVEKQRTTLGMLRDFEVAADWYIRCLEDIQDGRVVRGLAEAKAAYDSARDGLYRKAAQ